MMIITRICAVVAVSAVLTLPLVLGQKTQDVQSQYDYSKIIDIFDKQRKRRRDTTATTSSNVQDSQLKSMFDYLVHRSGGDGGTFDGDAGNFNILLSLIDLVPDLNGRLYDGGDLNDITLFAPRDDSFYKLAKDLGYDGDRGDEVKVFNFLSGVLSAYAAKERMTVEDLVGNILLYHMGNKSMTENRLRRRGYVTTYNEDKDKLKVIKARQVDNKKRTKLISRGSNAILHRRQKDIRTSNGYIHDIKYVLLPVDDLVSASKTSDAAYEGDDEADDQGDEKDEGCARTTYPGVECEGGTIGSIEVATSLSICRRYCAAKSCISLMFDLSRNSCYLYRTRPNDLGDKNEDVVCELVGASCEADDSVYEKESTASPAQSSDKKSPTSAPYSPLYDLERFEDFCDRRGGEFKTFIRNRQSLAICQVCPGADENGKDREGGQGCCYSTIEEPNQWQCEVCVMIEGVLECNPIKCINMGSGAGFFCRDCAGYSAGSLCFRFYCRVGLCQCNSITLDGQDCGECDVDLDNWGFPKFEVDTCIGKKDLRLEPSPAPNEMAWPATPAPRVTRRPTPALRPSTQWPTSSSSASSITCVPTTGPCVSSASMLQRAVIGLVPDDVIAVCDGASIQTFTSAEIDKNNVTLCCASGEERGCELLGRRAHRILLVTGENFTMSGIEFYFGVGEESDSNGGNVAIVASGHHRIINCLFGGGNAEEGYGGNLYVRAMCGGTVTLQQSVFEKGVARYGGGVAIEDAMHIIVEDCIMQNNYGGGFFVAIAAPWPELRNPGPTMEFRNTIFSENMLEGGSGGGIFASALGSLPSLLIDGCVFDNNHADSGGAGSIWPDLSEFASLQFLNNRGTGNYGEWECNGFLLGTTQLGPPDDSSAVCIDDLTQTIDIVSDKKITSAPTPWTCPTPDPLDISRPIPSPRPTRRKTAMPTPPPPTPAPSVSMPPTFTASPVASYVDACAPTTGPCISSEVMFQDVARNLAPNDTVAICGTADDIRSWSFEVDSSTIIDQHNITLCCAGPKLCRIRAISRRGQGLADDRILVVTGHNFTVIGLSFMFGVGGRPVQRLTGNTRDASAGGGNLVIAAEGDHLIANSFFGGGFAERPLDGDPSDFYRGVGGNVYVRTSGKVTIRETTFERGVAQLGGGVAIDATKLVVEDSMIRGNLNSALFTNLAWELRGNPITQVSQTIELRRTTFSFNQGDFGGGFLATALGSLPSLLIQDCIFEGNEAKGNGGAGAIFPDEGIFASLELSGNSGKDNIGICGDLLFSAGEGYLCIDVDQEVSGRLPSQAATALTDEEVVCPTECLDCLQGVSEDWLTFCLQADGGCGRDEEAAYIYSGDGYKVREGRCDISFFSGGWCTQLAITVEEQEACVKKWQPVVDRYIVFAGSDGSCKAAIEE